MTVKSKLDEEYLLSLARQKDPDGRQTLSAVMTDLFGQEFSSLSEQERTILFDILHRLIQNMEKPIRKMLAEHMSAVNTAPHGLTSALANDSFEIARPILQNGNLLSERDLIDVICHQSGDHRLAIAKRERVSELVSGALVDFGEEDVIHTLLNNDGVRFSIDTMSELVEKSRSMKSIQEPLLHRSELPEKLATRMFQWVSTALRQFVLQNWDVDEEALNAEAAQNGPASTALAVDRLANPILLILSIHAADRRLFEANFRELTGFQDGLVEQLLHEEDGQGLALVSKALGLSRHDFGRAFELVHFRTEMPRSMMQQLKKEAINLYQSVTVSDALSAVRQWQRGEDYDSAMRELTIGKNSSMGRRMKYERHLEALQVAQDQVY